MHDSPSKPRQEGIAAALRRNLFKALGRADLEQAALLLERLKEEDPLSVETRGSELDYLLRSGRLTEARGLADQLVKLFPASPRIQYLSGRVAYRIRQYERAAECFRESHSLYPNWRTSWWLAKALTQLGDFDQAASFLEALAAEHSECGLDLAWLYERKQHYDRALVAVESYLKLHPNSEMAKTQLVRLRARVMDDEELVEETKGLLEFGEEISDSVVPEYLESLFRTGRWQEARQFVSQRSPGFNDRLATSAGWVCYRAQAYDLAFDLFVMAFDVQRGNVKFLAALEFAAKRSGRDAPLIQLYQAHAEEDRRLYGRLQRLRHRSSSTDKG